MFISGVSNEKLFTSPNNGRETELHIVKILSYVSSNETKIHLRLGFLFLDNH
jgi:hypothetical protein